MRNASSQDLADKGAARHSGEPATASKRHRAVRAAMRWVLAVFYMLAGILHLAIPDKFLLIVPDWAPLPYETILVTGLCEIAGSAGLLFRRTARLAGIMLALYAICVFPANIKHAAAGIEVPGMPNSWWYHGPRLAFQPVLVWWALFCVGLIDWPTRGGRAPPRS
jgi:uncharacterized membrane protein